MNTTLRNLFFSLFLISSLSAKAGIWPGYERPILFVELEETGGLLRTVYLNQTDGAEAPTTITLETQQHLRCSEVEPCANAKERSQFVIERIENDGCGSIKYTASADVRKLELFDHTNRSCEDLKEAPWEISLTTRMGSVEREEEFFGTPQPFYPFHDAE